MEGKHTTVHIVFGILLVVLFVAATLLLPRANWGKLQFLPGQTVTVTGEAETQQKNQVATFSAGVTSTRDNKDEAIAEVNAKIEALVRAVKDFGIKDEDIKTQNLSVYQREETYYEEGIQKARPGQWSVSNSIEIKLRDVDRAAQLTSLLTKSGATNIYGPNFSFEDVKSVEGKLLEEAIDNAKNKAEALAKKAGRRLGKVVSITEGSVPVGILPVPLEAGGGGGGIEPGTKTVQKTVTVVFELE